MGSEGEHHPRFLQSRKWNACGGVAAHADAMLQDGPARLGDCDSQSGIASHRHSRWFFVLHPSISAYPSARSDRKRGLAKLPLDDGLLRSCGTRPGRQLQHSRALAIAQARD